MDFVHLHNHTEYTINNGITKIEEIVKKASEFKMKALAITDSGSIEGFDKFKTECEKNNIKAIFSCGYYFVQGSIFDKTDEKSHLVLIARNKQGLKNLEILDKISNLEGYYKKPRIDKEMVEKYNEGLICLTGGLGGAIDKYIVQDMYKEAKKLALYFKNIFKENFYLELQNHNLEKNKLAIKGLNKLSKDLNIKRVVSQGCFYLKKEDFKLCNKIRKKYGNKELQGSEFYFKSKEEMIELFKDYKEEVLNTIKIAELCLY